MSVGSLWRRDDMNTASTYCWHKAKSYHPADHFHIHHPNIRVLIKCLLIIRSLQFRINYSPGRIHCHKKISKTYLVFVHPRLWCPPAIREIGFCINCFLKRIYHRPSTSNTSSTSHSEVLRLFRRRDNWNRTWASYSPRPRREVEMTAQEFQLKSLKIIIKNNHQYCLYTREGPKKKKKR